MDYLQGLNKPEYHLHQFTLLERDIHAYVRLPESYAELVQKMMSFGLKTISHMDDTLE